MVTLSAVSQTANKPSLVVSIVVDQLRSDYIELLQERFSEDGFNRLINEAVYISNIDYNTAYIDAVSATSVIHTGTYPRISGVSGAYTFNSETKSSQKTLNDGSTNSDNDYTPNALTVSTIADELRISNGALGYVYSIAPDAQQSVIMAGHAGNSAFWINDNTCIWCTSSYYPQVPALMHKRRIQSIELMGMWSTRQMEMEL